MQKVERDRVELEGLVTDSCKGKFTVKVNESYEVMATLSGRIRQNEIKILVGDKVKVEVSIYDTSKGRIISRLKS